jgi:hypothetical protein
LLAFVGYAQSLLAGKLEAEPVEPATERAVVVKAPAQPVPARLVAELEPAYGCDAPGCGRSFATQAALNAHKRAHANGNHRHEPAEAHAANES